VSENTRSLFDGFESVSDSTSSPEDSVRFFGRYRRNPVLIVLAFLLAGSVWPWFVNVSSLYKNYEANRNVVDPWANGSGVDDLARAASGVAANAGAATTVLWCVVAGLFIAVCLVVGILAAYAHSTRAPRGTAILGVVLVAVWVAAAIFLHNVADASVTALVGSPA